MRVVYGVSGVFSLRGTNMGMRFTMLRLGETRAAVAIESLHMQLRKIVKTRGHFPIFWPKYPHSAAR